MRAADFFCGRGGWTHGLMAAGFDVDGYDIEPQPAYPARFHQQDVRELDPADFWDLDVACFSPPCQGFSLVNPQVHRGERPNDLDMELARWPREFIEAMPPAHRPRWWVVENVQGAGPSFDAIYGPRALKYGSFWLWGQLPGFMVERSNARLKFGGNRWNTGTRKQKVPYRDPAITAMIPLELARPFAEACRPRITVVEGGEVK